MKFCGIHLSAVLKITNIFENFTLKMTGLFPSCWWINWQLSDLLPFLCFAGSSMSSANTSHQSAHSMVSGQSTSSDKSGEYSDETNDLLDPGGPHRNYRDRTQAWWSVGEYLENGHAKPLTHQSARFSLTGNRVFSNQRDELWDLSDSLMELYEQNQNENMTNTLQMAKKCRLDRDVDVREWLAKDTTHGFIRVCPPDENYGHSQLVPCSLSTTAHKICHILGISVNALHIQLNGDIIRRLDPYEHPLVLQNEYLSGLGYSDIQRMQEEGMHEEIRYIICFYAGKGCYRGHICGQGNCPHVNTMGLHYGKSTLVQVMAWCHQAPSYYLNQCWPSSVLSLWGHIEARTKKADIWLTVFSKHFL